MLASLKRQQQEELENSPAPSPRRNQNKTDDSEDPTAQIKATDRALKESNLASPRLDVCKFSETTANPSIRS